MATASSNPTSPALNAAAGGVSSPKSRRWTQIVGESELVVPVVIPPQCPPSPSTSVAQDHMESVSGWATGNSPLQDTATEAQPESFENSDSGNNAVKKPAWNKPNGSTEAGPVMGAVSWPALSESTKASPKSVSYDPLKTPLDGSVPPPQVIPNCMQLKQCHILFSFIFFYILYVAEICHSYLYSSFITLVLSLHWNFCT